APPSPSLSPASVTVSSARSRRRVSDESVAQRAADVDAGVVLEPEEHRRGVELEDLVAALAVGLEVHAGVAEADHLGRAHARARDLVVDRDRLDALLVPAEVD